MEESADGYEHLCLWNHPGHVLRAYDRFVGFCNGDSTRLVFHRLWAIFCPRRFTVRNGGGRNRVVPNPLYNEEHEIFPASGTFRYARQINADGLDGVVIFLFQRLPCAVVWR